MNISVPISGGTILLLAILQGCGSPSDRARLADRSSIVFRLTGLKGQPGMFTDDASETLEQLLKGIDGVFVVNLRQHPGNRLDNSVSVQYDPKETAPAVIAAKAREVWGIIWYSCETCGDVDTNRRVCHGKDMEESS